MADEVVGKVLVIGQGEALSNGGTKYPLVLDNGSQLVTFSEKCKDAVSSKLGEMLRFDVEPPAFEGGHPKVTKVTDGAGKVLWEPSQRGGSGGGGGGDPVAQDARTCVITAGALIAARANAYENVAAMEVDVAEMSAFLANLLRELATAMRT